MAEGYDPKLDPVMAFFDMSKPFKPINAGRSLPRPQPVPWQEEKDDDNVDCDDDYPEESYWVTYQEKANQDLMQSAMAANSINQDQKLPSSDMSAVDSMTVVSGMQGLDLGRERMDPKRLTNLYDFSTRKNVGDDLDITKEKERILDVIKNNAVCLISGQTGCGKTTQIPQFILDDYAKRQKYVNIIVTQPRRIAAESVARRVCEERGWQLGHRDGRGGLVGYKVGLDKANYGPETRLLFCTTGILRKMLVNKKSLQDWTHVILDEVHEREEDMDFVLLLCKKLHFLSRNTKIILMSATFNIESFIEYFKFPIPGLVGQFIFPAKHEIEAKTDYAIIEHYSTEIFRKCDMGHDLPDFTNGPKLFPQVIDLCKSILEMIESREKEKVQLPFSKEAVLIFLPGENEILRVKKVLEQSASCTKWDILILHSKVPVEDMQLVFKQPQPGKRKIILATNIAESSITIPHVGFVIDFCLTKNLMADPDTNYVSLQLMWADQSSLVQRRGRTGRVCNGRVYRLISKDFYESGIPEMHPPEMKRAPLDKVILDTKMLDFGQPKELLALAMDPPDINNIHKTIMRLKEVGALLTTVKGVVSKDDGDLTVLGELLAGLPVDVCLGKLIVYGHLFDVLEECIIIAAGLSNKPIFVTPLEKKLEAYCSKLIWANQSFSDCLAVLYAYKNYHIRKNRGNFHRVIYRDGINVERKWCADRFISFKNLKDMDNIVKEISESLRIRFNITATPTPNRPPLNWPQKIRYIQYCIFGAFYPNYFVYRRQPTIDMRVAHREVGDRDPSNSVYLRGLDSKQLAHGYLYEDQIKTMFEKCASKDKIVVAFDSNRIVVQFGPKNVIEGDQEGAERIGDIEAAANATGRIVDSVYKAVKLRQSRETLALKIYRDVDKALKKFNEARHTNDQSFAVKSEQLVKVNSLGIVEPPSLDTKGIDLEVVHVTNPSSIWVQYATDDVAKKLENVEEAIEKVIEGAIKKLPIVKDHLCLAPFDDSFYRAKVDKSNEKGVHVTFIDYGNSTIVKDEKDIWMVPAEVAEKNPALKTEALAFECTLMGIKPNPQINLTGLWDVSAAVYVRDALAVEEKNNTFRAEIYSVVPKVDSFLVSITVPGENFISLNDELCSLKYSVTVGQNQIPVAVQTSESYLSDMNHNCRIQSKFSHAEWKKHVEERQKPEAKETALSLNELDLPPPFTGEANLRGPFNPLEHKVTAVHRVGIMKDIRVDLDSVNSVMIDQYPTDCHDQWLVAGNVVMNPSGSTLKLRSTTLLPNQYGLGALLTMVFAPFVEMRCDPLMKRYTGFLAGLGDRESDWGRRARMGEVYGARSKEPKRVPYDGDHDMEILFDVAINEEDINLINKIRYYLNAALTGERFGRNDGTEERRGEIKLMKINNMQNLVDIQEKLHRYIDELLSRPRESKERECFKRENKWNQISEEHQKRTDITDADRFVFKMINAIQLNEANETNAQLQKEVNRFHQLAKKPFTYLDERCPICPNKKYTSSMEISMHIEGTQHRRFLEEKL